MYPKSTQNFGRSQRIFTKLLPPIRRIDAYLREFLQIFPILDPHVKKMFTRRSRQSSQQLVSRVGSLKLTVLKLVSCGDETPSAGTLHQEKKRCRDRVWSKSTLTASDGAGTPETRISDLHRTCRAFFDVAAHGSPRDSPTRRSDL